MNDMVWARSTSADPDGWTPENPTFGQCAVTALLVQDIHGGELLRGKVGQVSHYWNRLPDGSELDLTWEQFPAGTAKPVGDLRTREYVLSFPDTETRYLRLKRLNGYAELR